ncbi:TPA: hypothetical protein H1008_01605 [archaeon]|nr:hypothetical protein [Candidatus Undinarchaeales archaeon SRR5007147.bin71]
MKRIFLGILICTVILSGQAYAALDERCSVESIGISSEYTNRLFVDIVYNFKCSAGASDEGQLTRASIHYGTRDIGNLILKDRYGELTTDTIPSDYEIDKGLSSSELGLVFRKSLEMTSYETNYILNLSFETGAIVSKADDGKLQAQPSDLIGNITGISVRNTIESFDLGIGTISYSMKVPKGTVITNAQPDNCLVSGETVICNGLDENSFSEILIKWKQSEEVTQENSKLTEIADKVSTKVEELAKEATEEETKKQVKGLFEKMKEKLSGLFDWL